MRLELIKILRILKISKDFMVFRDVSTFLISFWNLKNNISESTSIILLFDSYGVHSWSKKKHHRRNVIKYTTTCIRQDFSEGALEFFHCIYPIIVFKIGAPQLLLISPLLNKM